MRKRIIATASAFFCILLMTACGQKGPLYIPEEPERMGTPEERTTPNDEVVPENV